MKIKNIGNGNETKQHLLSLPKTKNGILNIPRKKLATCLEKCEERDCVAVHFEKGVAPILNAKMRFRP